jgi:hypothetical protein
MKLYDIVLFPWAKVDLDNAERRPILWDIDSVNNKCIHKKGVIRITDFLKFTYIPDRQYKRIYTNCLPKALKDRTPKQQMYTLIHELNPDDNENDRMFDAEIQNDNGIKYNPLAMCIALSRIVHPTTLSFEFSAKIQVNDFGKTDIISPGLYRGLSTEAFVVDTENNYLTENDVKLLKQIYNEYVINPLNGTLRNALWYNEYAALTDTNMINVRWLFYVIALEGIVNTGENISTRQFTERIPPLSEMVSSDTITKTEAKKIYNERSKLAHGQRLTTQNLHLYPKLEKIVRCLILKSLVDPDFRKNIENREWIMKKWPVTKECKFISELRHCLNPGNAA